MTGYSVENESVRLRFLIQEQCRTVHSVEPARHCFITFELQLKNKNPSGLLIITPLLFVLHSLQHLMYGLFLIQGEVYPVTE